MLYRGYNTCQNFLFFIPYFLTATQAMLEVAPFTLIGETDAHSPTRLSIIWYYALDDLRLL